MDYIEKIDHGATRPFKVRSDSGDVLVVKGFRGASSGKSLFSELLSGRLARMIQLPWPEVSVLRLTPEVMARAAADGIELRCPAAVAIAWVDGAPLPLLEGLVKPGLGERNLAHLQKHAPGLLATDDLYGRVVFDNWVDMTDCKYDTVLVQPNGPSTFIDGTHAFGGPDWQNAQDTWRSTGIMVRTPYCEGATRDWARHRPWLQRIAGLAPGAVAACFDGLPEEWALPQESVSALRDLFASNSRTFIDNYEAWIGYEEMRAGGAA